MLVFVIFAVVFVYFFKHLYWKRRNLPPGPMPLPLIGNLHQMGKSEFVDYGPMESLRARFGDIVTFWAAQKPMIVVFDYDLMQETFVRDGEAYSGRYAMGRFNELVRKGDFGMVFVDGPFWKEHRRFALQVFRDFGMGKNLMEEKINVEVGYFLDSIRSAVEKQECEVNLVPKVEITVANVINQLLFGFAYHDNTKAAEFAKMKDVIAAHMRRGSFPGTALTMHFPILKHVPFFKEKYHSFVSGYYEIVDYCRAQIEEHKNKFVEDQDSLDYTEAYLRESKKRPEVFTEHQLENILYDMFIAGQETTANTIIFALLYALNYPEKQAKLHQELDAKIGSDRRITLADKHDLPFVNAFIFETQRLVNLLPMNLPHKTLKTVQIRGYTVPKNTIIVPQISMVLFDQKYFPEPHEFRPERFVDENGQLKKIDAFVPFSIGKRQCLGESLARMELYILISNFFNQFEIRPVNPDSPPTLQKKRGVTVQPLPFNCIVKKRFS